MRKATTWKKAQNMYGEANNDYGCYGHRSNPIDYKPGKRSRLKNAPLLFAVGTFNGKNHNCLRENQVNCLKCCVIDIILSSELLIMIFLLQTSVQDLTAALFYPAETREK